MVNSGRVAFEKFFTVHTPENVRNYLSLQQKKYVVLYALFIEKLKEQQDKKQNFFEYVQKFLQKDDVSSRMQVGLESGFKFSLALLKEVRSLSKDALLSSLEYLYQTLRASEPNSLYGTDKLSFMVDSNLNDARAFLFDLAQDTKAPDRAKELALKLILLLGIVRSNAEDLLLVASLLSKLQPNIDLREELALLKDEG